MCHWEEKVESHWHRWENHTSSWRMMYLRPPQWMGDWARTRAYFDSRRAPHLQTPGLTRLVLPSHPPLFSHHQPSSMSNITEVWCPSGVSAWLEVGRRISWVTKDASRKSILHWHLTTFCSFSFARFYSQLSLIALGRRKTAEVSLNSESNSCCSNSRQEPVLPVLAKWLQLGDPINRRWDSLNEHPSVGLLLIALSDTWQKHL